MAQTRIETLIETEDKGNYYLRPIAVFDLDKTIRRNKDNHEGFIHGPDCIELMPGIKERFWALKDAGYLTAYVTNQGGIAYGKKTSYDNITEIRRTAELLQRSSLPTFDYGEFCSKMEGGKVNPYGFRSMFRKPNIGMLASIERSAMSDSIIIDWKNSFIVGDSDEDRQLAINSGLFFYLIDSFLTMPVEDIVLRVQTDIINYRAILNLINKK